MKKNYLLLLAFSFFVFTQNIFSQISLTTPNGTYTENFDVMGATGTTYPTGWTAIRIAGTGTANATLVPTVSNGGSNAGNSYNVGTTSASDRALGTLASGTTIPAFGASFVNNTGSSISSFSLSGFHEQWRTGSNAVAETVFFEYSTDATSLSTGTWTGVSGLNLEEILTSNNLNTAVDGNDAANRVAISGTISSISLAPGATIWIRWRDVDNTGSDGLYALDDFQMTYSNGGGVPNTVSVSAGIDMAEPATNGTFNISLSNPAPVGGVTITYTLGGTAILNTDYSDPQSGSITITQGNNSGTITLNVIDDPFVEPTKTIIITLQTASNGYTLGTSMATINLTDDDIPPASSISLIGVYTQDFNTLANTGTSSTLPTGWLLSESLANANILYTANNGGSNAGDTYSYGATSNTERAFGTLQSGSLLSTIGAAVTNNTGTTITTLKISYTGEQWRLGATGRTDQLDFQYSLNATSLTTGTWTDVNQLDFVAPVQAGTVGALDGNSSANRTLITFSITGLSIPNGASFYIRWNDFNAAGADDGLGIDDFSMEANPVDLPPVINMLSPANGATNVPVNISALITFNENVQKGSGNIIIKKTSDNSIFQTINVSSPSVVVTGTDVSFPISGLAAFTGYYIEITAGAFTDLGNNDFAGISGNSTWAFATGNIIYAANFNTCTSSLTDGFTQFSVVGPQVWACTAFGRDPNNLPSGSAPNGVQINGFNVTNIPNEDWLISPSFNLTGTTFPLLSFWSRTRFNGDPLQLKVSTDYPGTGDPRSYTWTDINGKFPGQTTDVWTLSNNINLSAFKASNVYIAFVYYSSDEDGARWTLDDINLINSATPPPPSLTVSTTDILYNYVAAGSTADKTFTFTANDIIANVSVNSTGNFTVSKDGVSFSSSLLYTILEANNIQKTVFVRFAPNVNDQEYTGTITVATSPLSANINLKGSSIDPATTLEVVNWNIEWFGSPVQNPPNDNLQEQNVKTILQNIGADIYGLVEVVNESRLANVVSQMPGYSYVIGNFGSHVNPPDPTGGPVSDAQKLAFVYKTSVFSNVSARPFINNQNTASVSYNNWSSGRYPFLFKADVTLRCVKKTVYFILIHAKANTSPTATSYARRQAGANELYDSIMTYFPNDHVIILGDFNDDLDQTITDGIVPPNSSYKIFTDDMTNFFAPTLALSLAGKKSTVGFNDMIDHVVLTNDIQPYYMPSSANVLTDVSSLVANYGSTTTDHYPIFTRYRFEVPAVPTITCPSNIVQSNDKGSCNAVVNYTVSYSDVCNSAIILQTSGLTSGSAFPIGTTTNSFRVTDANGNTATCSFTVTINDSEAPQANCKNKTITLSNGAASITLADIDDNSTDNCGIQSRSLSKTMFNCSNIGANSVTLTVTDVNGNSSTCNATVTVVGEIPSCTITAVPENNIYTGGVATNIYLGYGPQSVTLNVNANGGAPFTYSWSGSGGLSCTNCPNPVFAPSSKGVYNFTVTVTNKYGCTSTCNITICVLDIRVPGSNDKVYICHAPPGNPANGQTQEVKTNSVPAHLLSHPFDKLGKCGQDPCEENPLTLNTKGTGNDETAIQVLNLSISPNPSRNNFNLVIQSNSNAIMTLRIVDIYGRVISSQPGISPNSVIRLGDDLKTGVYFAQLIQGTETRIIKLVKIN